MMAMGSSEVVTRWLRNPMRCMLPDLSTTRETLIQLAMERGGLRAWKHPAVIVFATDWWVGGQRRTARKTMFRNGWALLKTEPALMMDWLVAHSASTGITRTCASPFPRLLTITT